MKLVFLSHIHEEKDLAMLFKASLEEEFSGFVEIFVSSDDGITIPSGTNFLKRIENGLIESVGGLYLISPISMKRSWINFELGALWIRNVQNERSNIAHIPTIPVCHSGITTGTLPFPLSVLSGINADRASELQTAFRSLQTSVGGRGALKTDFSKLAQEIAKFEKKNTLGKNLKLLFSTIFPKTVEPLQKIIALSKTQPDNPLQISVGVLKNETIDEIESLRTELLPGLFEIQVGPKGTHFTSNGAINGAPVTIKFFSARPIVEYESSLIP